MNIRTRLWKRRGEETAGFADCERKTTKKTPVILVPVDVTADSLPAVKAAINLAKELEARMILFHAIHLNLSPFGPANVDRLMADLRSEAAVKVKILASFAQMAAVPVQCLIGQGPVAAAILNAAKQNSASLMVMMAGKAGWWREFFGNNLTKCVARNAACTVLVLSPEKNRADESNKLRGAPSNFVEVRDGYDVEQYHICGRDAGAGAGT